MIPRHLHAIWVGPPLPPTFQEFLEGWRQLHPAWGFTLWNEENMPPLENQNLYDHVSDFCPGFEGQLRSDIARYEILWRHGGVYLDVDFEPIKPIDALLEGAECFTAWEIQDQVANNAIFGCSPGHPFMRYLIDGLEESIRRNPGKRPSKVSGPHYMTAKLRQYGQDVTVYDRAMFYRIGCKDLHRLSEPHHPEEWARHYWNNQHRIKGKTL